MPYALPLSSPNPFMSSRSPENLMPSKHRSAQGVRSPSDALIYRHVKRFSIGTAAPVCLRVFSLSHVVLVYGEEFRASRGLIVLCGKRPLSLRRNTDHRRARAHKATVIFRAHISALFSRRFCVPLLHYGGLNGAGGRWRLSLSSPSTSVLHISA